MMCLELGQRDHEIGVQQRDRKRELLKTGKRALQRYDCDVIVIEVHEPYSLLPQLIVQSRRRQKVLHVAPVAGPLADDHLGRARSPARDRRARNHVRMRVDHRVELVFHHVRF